jgi:hypothetical protein
LFSNCNYFQNNEIYYTITIMFLNLRLVVHVGYAGLFCCTLCYYEISAIVGAGEPVRDADKDEPDDDGDDEGFEADDDERRL